MTMQFNAALKVEREYPLSCQIRSINKTVHDETIEGKANRYETTQYFLVPQESTYRSLFYDAWLPSADGVDYELAAVIHSPINKEVRLSIKMANKECHEHHFSLMSVEQEEELARYVKWCRKEGSCPADSYPSIKLTVLPQSKEDGLDI